MAAVVTEVSDFGDQASPQEIGPSFDQGGLGVTGSVHTADVDAFQFTCLGNGPITVSFTASFNDCDLFVYDGAGQFMGLITSGLGIILNGAWGNTYSFVVSANSFNTYSLGFAAPAGHLWEGTSEGEFFFSFVDGDVFLQSGQDTLYGKEGNDTLVGGEDADTIYGGYGDDRIGFQTSRADGIETGRNLIFGGPGNDDIYHGFDASESYGGQDDDTQVGASGGDMLFGGSGNDLLNGWNGDDRIDGGDGSDTARFGAEVPAGSAGPGYLVDLRKSVAITFEGNDTLVSIENVMAGWLDDTLIGNALANTLDGREGNDSLSGNAGDDLLFCSDGDDVALGGDGNDTINGGDGDDVLSGGLGNDRFSDSGGNTTLRGGDGFDFADFSERAIALRINLALVDQTIGGFGLSMESIEGLRTGIFDDRVIGNEFANAFVTGDGADRILAGDGNDSIDAGTGHDTVVGGAGIDRLFFETGDAIKVDLSLTDKQNTGLGGKILSSVEQVVTRGGNDSLTGNELANAFFSNDGKDTLSGGAGDDNIDGGAGSDLLFGGSGNDFIFGGTGADNITGSEGADDLTAGADIVTDTFIYTSVRGSNTAFGIDTIRGFNPLQDRIDLSQIDADPGTANNQAFLFSKETPAAHSVWISVVPGGSFVHADVSGDALADFTVAVVDVSSFAGAIIL